MKLFILSKYLLWLYLWRRISPSADIFINFLLNGFSFKAICCTDDEDEYYMMRPASSIGSIPDLYIMLDLIIISRLLIRVSLTFEVKSEQLLLTWHTQIALWHKAFSNTATHQTRKDNFQINKRHSLFSNIINIKHN